MHELSIATSLVKLAKQYQPAGTRVREVHVQAGPLQAIDEGALDWAWRSATNGTALQGSQLRLEQLPWRLRCPDCGRRWAADSLDEPCTCGALAGILDGGDELQLVSLDVFKDSSGGSMPIKVSSQPLARTRREKGGQAYRIQFSRPGTRP